MIDAKAHIEAMTRDAMTIIAAADTTRDEDPEAIRVLGDMWAEAMEAVTVAAANLNAVAESLPVPFPLHLVGQHARNRPRPPRTGRWR